MALTLEERHLRLLQRVQATVDEVTFTLHMHPEMSRAQVYRLEDARDQLTVAERTLAGAVQSDYAALQAATKGSGPE